MDFEPGEYLQVKELHYNQHGMMMLQGQVRADRNIGFAESLLKAPCSRSVPAEWANHLA